MELATGSVRSRTKKERSLSRKSMVIYFLLTLPALLLFLWFFCYPVFMGVLYSFTNWDGISKAYKFIGFSNYTDIFRESRFIGASLFTVKYTIIAVFLKTSISTIVSLLLFNVTRFRGFLRSVYFLPGVLSLLTISLVFNEIFREIVPHFGQFFGIELLSRNILGYAETALFGIVIVNVWHGIAVPIVILLAGLTSVPKDLLEAAKIDGANRVQSFFAITLPFLIPMLTVVIVLAFKSGFSVFDSIMALTGGGPGTSTESIAFLIYKHGLNEYKFGRASAESLVLFLIIAAVSFIQIKWLNRKEVGQQ
ncbi:sugar ABC transporter permease [Paenibacillus doosanensis]|uniref:carbohydrate ABC transporter permease n=1 Tax=Paenibacillus doosanensis TaxID=1229154 RepID=UPI0021805766|nr:sugar ABC transporter permease [Paenibacillus doosanensis]MCS7461451.1 sugar ABC transporter permease [Paenibacillus doosanensis]